MAHLRRQAPLLGIMLAFIIALSAALGGLTLARTLPQAHAHGLGGALCLGDRPDAPNHDDADHAAGCILCPGHAKLQSVQAPPPAFEIGEPRRAAADLDFVRMALRFAPEGGAGAAQARAPPRA